MGWIKLHRSLLDNPIIRKPEYLCIWNVLLLLASYKDANFIFNNIKQELKPGQFITGRKKLSDLTGICESQVYKILKYLKTEQQIELKSNNRNTLITILNWEKYQEDVTTELEEKEQPNNSQVTATKQPGNTFKKYKNIKNIDTIDYQLIIDLYNDTCISLDKANSLSEERKKSIKKIYPKYPIEKIIETFTKLENSDWHTGRDSKSEWKADFSWIIEEKNFIKIYERTNGVKSIEHLTPEEMKQKIRLEEYKKKGVKTINDRSTIST